GLNRINWNVRYDTPPAFVHDMSDTMGAMESDTPAAVEGPLALPGEYTVRLIVDGRTYSQKMTVKNDPRSTSTHRDMCLENQFRLNIYAGAQETWDGYHQAMAIRAAIASILNAKPSADIPKAGAVLDDKLAKLAGTVYRERRAYGPPPPDSFVNMNGYLLTHLDLFDYGDIAPTEAMMGSYGSDWSKLHAMTEQWRSILAKDLVAFNALLKKNNLKPIDPPTPSLIDPPAPPKRFIPPKQPAQRGVATAAPVG